MPTNDEIIQAALRQRVPEPNMVPSLGVFQPQQQQNLMEYPTSQPTAEQAAAINSLYSTPQVSPNQSYPVVAPQTQAPIRQQTTQIMQAPQLAQKRVVSESSSYSPAKDIKEINKASEKLNEAITSQAINEQKGLQQVADLENDLAIKAKRFQLYKEQDALDYQQKADEAIRNIDNATKEYNNTSFKDFWADKTTGDRVLAGIGIA